MTRFLTCTDRGDLGSRRSESEPVLPLPTDRKLSDVNGFTLLVTAVARERQETRQAEGMSPEAALLLPLACSLARLKARQSKAGGA